MEKLKFIDFNTILTKFQISMVLRINIITLTIVLCLMIPVLLIGGNNLKIDYDLLSDSAPSIEEQNLAPRIDGEIASESCQIIRITGYEQDIYSENVENSSFESDIHFILQADILKRINEYKENLWTSFTSMSGDVVINKPPDDDTKYWISQYNPSRLEAAINYLNSEDEPFIFISHFGTQYSFNKPDKTDRAHNLVITDFVTKYKTDSWNTFLPFSGLIPTEKMGSAKYSFNINNETINFRSIAMKKIWSFKDIYWGYAKIYSTRNGKDKAPLLIEMSDPMDSYLDNGFYLIIPK